MGNKIYVGNLLYTTTEEELKSLFSPYGNTTSIKLIMDKVSGRSKGFGFIEFDSAEAVKKAVEALNQSDFGGRKIIVSEAHGAAPGSGPDPRTGRKPGTDPGRSR